MLDDFHSTAIVLETLSDICLEDRRSVEYIGNKTGARLLSALYVVT